MLISFEGIDGCGKSTQISLLRNWLESEEYPVQMFREPGGVELAEQIRSLLLNTSHVVDPVTELLLFSAARSQLIAEQVKPLLEAGEIVILDRFYDSTTAYQGFGRESVPLEEIRTLNRIAGHGLVPDLTFYLRISYELSQERTAGGEKDRMERSGEPFFTRVIAGFDKLARDEPRFRTLDASRSPEEIHRKIRMEVSNRL
ncbi:MAG: dTMP kinase [Balneolaceae bacterium]